jgi:quinol monooxygenase YgiN
MFTAIAIHHAAPEHTDEFIDFMHKVIDAVGDAPGLLEFTACRDPRNGFLAGFSRWESAEAFQAARSAISSLGPLRKPEWSTKPDELITLVEAA